MINVFQESILDNVDKRDERLIPDSDADVLSTDEWPDYMYVIENITVDNTPLKDGCSHDLLEHTIAAFGVRFKIWYLYRFEYEREEIIDHSSDHRFN